MKKLVLVLLGLFAVNSLSYAYITVEEARSAEKLKSEGYSESTINLVQKESGEFNPKPTNKAQKAGFRIWQWIDPAAPEPRDTYYHEIKLYPSYTDY